MSVFDKIEPTPLSSSKIQAKSWARTQTQIDSVLDWLDCELRWMYESSKCVSGELAKDIIKWIPMEILYWFSLGAGVYVSHSITHSDPSKTFHSTIKKLIGSSKSRNIFYPLENPIYSKKVVYIDLFLSSRAKYLILDMCVPSFGAAIEAYNTLMVGYSTVIGIKPCKFKSSSFADVCCQKIMTSKQLERSKILDFVEIVEKD